MKLQKSIPLLFGLGLILPLFIVNSSAQEQTVITENITGKQLNDQSLLAVNWVQHSAEYRALAYQAFNTGKIAFDQAIENKIENPAVVVDLDETILDNSPYQASLIGQDEGFNTKTWNQWVLAAEAKAIPGAVDFINYVNNNGGTVFFISNRGLKSDSNLSENDLEIATIKNLKDLDITGVNEETVMLKGEFTKEIDGRINNDKEWRREAIINGDVDGKKYNIVILAGDNLNDFTLNFENSSNNEQRKSLVDEEINQYGINKESNFPIYIVLPNPLYGDWEGGLYDPNEYNKNIWYELTPTQKDAQRRQTLIKWEN